jgi:hypothetical protein
MMKADRDLNQAMSNHDMARFLSFVAEDATFNTNRGREAVGKAWGVLRGGRSKISWR